MNSEFNLAGLIDPLPRQLERYAEDFRRLLDEHREVNAQLERANLESQRAVHLQRQMIALQQELAEPIASLEIIARLLLTRTGNDSMNRDLATTVLEKVAALQVSLTRVQDTTLEFAPPLGWPHPQHDRTYFATDPACPSPN